MIHPYIEGFSSVFKPRPNLLPSEWAERYRILPQTGSAEPGPWRNSRTPYLVDIMNELAASGHAKEVVLCKGTQIGATEAGLNWLMYLIDCIAGPIMALQPTKESAAEWSKQRIAPSLELCEQTKRKVAAAKSRSTSNTILAKEFDGGYFFIRGTNTPRALASLPIGNIYADEVDRYLKNVGKEGHPIKIVLKRISTYPRAKAFFSSTPTYIETSLIWDLYQDSDRRVYEVPCPFCGKRQEIKFDRLTWEKGNTKDVYLTCIECGELIAEHYKTQMLAGGAWRPTNPGHKRAGFHLSALYSPIGWLSWSEIVDEFIEAEGDEEKMIVFINTTLGLPWERNLETIASEYLTRRVEKYKAEVPDEVLMLTLAVDSQKDRLECELRGWGDEEESWGIKYKIFWGDPDVLESEEGEQPTVWEQLTEFRRGNFYRADGTAMQVKCTVIDSGGGSTDTVYQYAAKFEPEWVFAVKGGSQATRPLLSRPNRQGRHQALLWVLGVTQGKDLVFKRLKKEEPGPGYYHFPDDMNSGYDKHYYAGLISERRVMKDGVIHWECPRGVRNEPFDLSVYNIAAIKIRSPNWKDLKARRRNNVRGAQPAAAQSASVRPTVTRLGDGSKVTSTPIVPQIKLITE